MLGLFLAWVFPRASLVYLRDQEGVGLGWTCPGLPGLALERRTAAAQWGRKGWRKGGEAEGWM